MARWMHPRTRANRWPVQVIMITLALARHLAVVDGYARRAQAAAQTLLGRCVAGAVRNLSSLTSLSAFRTCSAVL